MSPNIFPHTFLVLGRLIIDVYCISVLPSLQTKILDVLFHTISSINQKINYFHYLTQARTMNVWGFKCHLCSDNKVCTTHGRILKTL